MLKKPNIPDDVLIFKLENEYGLDVILLTFLPLGADPDATVYRVDARDGRSYFLKLKRGSLNKVGITLPKFLEDQGIQQVLAPLTTHSNEAWVSLGDFHLVLYPFVNGKNGFELDLQEQQWLSFGSTLSQVHALALPPHLSQEIREESFSPTWRTRAIDFLQRMPPANEDEVTSKLLTLLHDKADEVQCMVHRAEKLASKLKTQPLAYVLCHADIHAGNVLTTSQGELYLVDWDSPVLAPKERDLMFVGGGVGGTWHQESENTLFYQGYGEVNINKLALSYYRYERIVEDVVVTCEELLGTNDGGDNRPESLRMLENQFLPKNVVTIAHKTYEDFGLSA